MSISPWETMSVTVHQSYLHELQADAARWRHVLEHLVHVRHNPYGEQEWFTESVYGNDTYPNVIDSLIEEAKREGR